MTIANIHSHSSHQSQKMESSEGEEWVVSMWREGKTKRQTREREKVQGDGEKEEEIERDSF